MADISITELCETVKSMWPASVESEGWYLGLISTLVTCGKLDALKPAYQHILSTTHATADSRSRISARIKDLIMKQTMIVGIPLTIMAAVQLASAEEEVGMPVLSREEQTMSSYYNRLSAVPELDDRGEAAMRMLYKSNLDPIMAAWKSHQVDYEWFEKRVIYGLFLSDYTFLSPFETEIVVLSSIMCQGLDSPTMWHIRGMRRLGVSVEDTEKVCSVFKLVAKWSGRDSSKWPMAKDVDIAE